MTKSSSTQPKKTVEPTDLNTALPEAFDPMEMAAFLDGEDNAELAEAMLASPALQTVALAGLDRAIAADAATAQALAARAAPLSRRLGSQNGLDAKVWLVRLTGWLGADWRSVTAGFALGLIGFGVGLAGGLGLGDIGINTDDILISASALDVFAFDTSTETTSIYASDAFEDVFGSIE